MQLFVFILFLIAIVGIVVLVSWYNSPRQKGARGERKVTEILSHLPDGYHVMNDVILQIGNRTTQIDHVVVSKYGVFVIETKNYRGDIYGDDNRQQWTQIIVTEVTYRKKWYKTYTHVTKRHFYNPVKQSISHSHVIQKCLSQWKQLRVIPIVAFAGYANINKVSSSNHVVYASNLLATIQSYGTECLSDLDVQNIIICLRMKNVRGVVDDKTHVTNVYASRELKRRKVAAGICPECGGSLVERNGRYGRFFGCSSYPKCRFTTH